MRELIEELVNRIESDIYFDSHFIINQLIRDAISSKDYVDFCSKHKTMASAHSELSKIISSLADVKYLDNMKSISYNIHQNATNCQLYKKKIN